MVIWISNWGLGKLNRSSWVYKKLFQSIKPFQKSIFLLNVWDLTLSILRGSKHFHLLTWDPIWGSRKASNEEIIFKDFYFCYNDNNYYCYYYFFVCVLMDHTRRNQIPWTRVTGSCELVSILGTEYLSSARAVYALNCWVMCPGQRIRNQNIM